jgi:hypothetical protein
MTWMPAGCAVAALLAGYAIFRLCTVELTAEPGRDDRSVPHCSGLDRRGRLGVRASEAFDFSWCRFQRGTLIVTHGAPVADYPP